MRHLANQEELTKEAWEQRSFRLSGKDGCLVCLTGGGHGTGSAETADDAEAAMDEAAADA